MLRNTKFLDPNNWSLIKRGWIYEAAVPFIGERPLDFFIRDDNDAYRGTVVSLSKNFDGPGESHEVVLGLKPRKVVVISSDNLNQKPDHFDVTVAKIYSIYEEDKFEQWYKDAFDGTHPFFAYLPKEVTGRECVVDLSSIESIHKNMLLEDKCDAASYMPAIDSKMEYCLSLGMHKTHQSIGAESGA